MSDRRKFNFGFNCNNPEVFVISEWQENKNPSVKFLIYRWIFALYFAFVLVLSLISAEKCNQINFYLIYLTNWNVVVNAFSSSFGAFLTSLHYRKIYKFEDSGMPTTFKYYWLMSTLSTTISISLSCVYWPLIYNGRDRGLNDSLTHAGNAIFMLVDLFISSYPPRFGHFVYPLGFGVFYGYIFSLIYTILGGTDRDNKKFIYSVLDWKDKPLSALTFSTLTIIFLILMQFILNALMHLRIFIKKYFEQNANTEENSNCEPIENFGFSNE